MSKKYPSLNETITKAEKRLVFYIERQNKTTAIINEIADDLAYLYHLKAGVNND